MSGIWLAAGSSRRLQAASVCRWLLAPAILTILGATLWPMIAATRDEARGVTAETILIHDGQSLQQYADDHHDALPPDTHGWAIGAYLRHDGLFYVAETRPGISIAWVGTIGGKHRRDFSDPNAVVLARSRETYNHSEYVVLFLDGHTQYMRPLEFEEAMRDQAKLIQQADVAEQQRRHSAYK